MNHLSAAASCLLRRGGGGHALPRIAAAPRPQLVLYEYEASPWCRRVREHLCALDLRVEIRPCPREALIWHTGPPLQAEGTMGALSRFRPEVKARGAPLVFPVLLDRTAGLTVSDSGAIVRHLWSLYSGSVGDVAESRRPAHLSPGDAADWPFRPHRRVAGATLPQHRPGHGDWRAPTLLDAWLDVPLLIAASACRPLGSHGVMAAPSRAPPPRRRDGRPSLVLAANEAHPPAKLIRETLSTLQLPYEYAPNAAGGTLATAAATRAVQDEGGSEECGEGEGAAAFSASLAFEDDASGFSTIDAEAAVAYLKERYGQGPPLSVWNRPSPEGEDWAERHRHREKREGDVGEPAHGHVRRVPAPAAATLAGHSSNAVRGSGALLRGAAARALCSSSSTAPPHGLASSPSVVFALKNSTESLRPKMVRRQSGLYRRTGVTFPAPPLIAPLPLHPSALTPPPPPLPYQDGILPWKTRYHGNLVYSDGTKLPSATEMEELMRKCDGSTERDTTMIVKVQAPVDLSNAGIGQMQPSTLLVRSRSGSLVQLVEESDAGHSTLLRCALRQRKQIGYCYAETGDDVRVASDEDEHSDGAQGFRVFTEMLPPDDARGW